MLEVVHTLTREQPPGWTGYHRRIDAELLGEVAWQPEQRPLAFIQEIFPFEMTLVQITCTGCGVTNAIGELAVYMHGMGTVIRCPSCDSVLIRVVQAKGRSWLDMRGVRVFQINTEG
jgi:hypothetical protein